MGGYLSTTKPEKVYEEAEVTPGAKIDVPPAMENVFAKRSCEPFSGLPFPLEGTRLIMRGEDGRLILSWTNRKEWSLVGGRSMSIAPGESDFSDYRAPVDARYVRDGKQLPTSDQIAVVVESPIGGLMREAREELMSDEIAKKSPNEGPALMSWLTDRIRNGRWTSSIAEKKNKTVAEFKTYLALGCVTLSTSDLARLNNDIAQYPLREHQRFESFDWSMSVLPDGSKKITIAVPSGTHIRKYDDVYIFGIYADAVLSFLPSAAEKTEAVASAVVDFETTAADAASANAAADAAAPATEAHSSEQAAPIQLP
jgi:hypothetical protein